MKGLNCLRIGLRKKLEAAANCKDCEILKEWIEPLVNHLYWCAASTPDGDVEVMAAKWLSSANHICGVHTAHDDTFPECHRFKECEHPPDVTGRNWISKG